MIDGIKIRFFLDGKEPKLPTNDGSTSTCLIDRETGEEVGGISHKRKNLKTKIAYKENKEGLRIPCFLELKGSLHKLYTNGSNYNLFTFSQLQETISEVVRVYDIEETKTKVVNLEFGVNCTYTDLPTEYLLSNLVYHKNISFNSFKDNGFTYKQASHNSHHIKAYNKGNEYRKNRPILRFEIKYMESREIKRMGVVNLSDLRKKDVFVAFYNDLVKKWNECIIYEKPTLKTPYSELQLQQCQNFNFWKNSNRMERSRERKKFRHYIEHYTANHQAKIEQEIQNQFNKFSMKEKTYLTNIKQPKTENVKPPQNEEMLRLRPYMYSVNVTPPKNTLNKYVIKENKEVGKEEKSKILSTEKTGSKDTPNLYRKNINLTALILKRFGLEKNTIIKTFIFLIEQAKINLKTT